MPNKMVVKSGQRREQIWIIFKTGHAKGTGDFPNNFSFGIKSQPTEDCITNSLQNTHAKFF